MTHSVCTFHNGPCHGRQESVPDARNSMEFMQQLPMVLQREVVGEVVRATVGPTRGHRYLRTGPHRFEWEP
jgi:hypothetical protein